MKQRRNNRYLRLSALAPVGLWLCSLLWFIAPLAAVAQNDCFSISVTPTQNVLPPQVGDYLQNPGKYFNISVTNKTDQNQVFYLCIQLEQVTDVAGMPASLSVSSPPEYPGTPFIVGGKQTLALTSEDMKRFFNHVPLSAMRFSADLFSTVGTSDYGLLPEGEYRVSISAYKWDQSLINQHGLIDTPIGLSNPDETGFNSFQVCYRAQAPQFSAPTDMLGVTELQNLKAIQLPLMNPVFTWTEPVVNCTRAAVNYTYTLTIKEKLSQQAPDEAMNYNPVIYEVKGLSTPQCILGQNAIKRLLDKHVYVAQVTARSNADAMSYLMVENQGKSQVLLFTPQMKPEEPVIPEVEEEEETEDEEKTDEKKDDDEYVPEDDEEEEDEDSYKLLMNGVDDVVGENDSLYVFRNPQLTKPDFDGNTKPALFWGASVRSEWERPGFVGGKGLRQDTLQFRYVAELYNLSGYGTKELALEQGLIYKGVVKGDIGADEALKALNKQKDGVDLLEDFIEWDSLKNKVSVGQALLLRVVPECVNEESVRFYGDQNEKAFQYTDELSEAFGNSCSGGVIEENRVPIEATAKDMRGKTIYVGEYEMQLRDELVLDEKKKSWSGKGWIVWKPFGQTVKVGVRFEDIFINDKYIMYEGVVKTETQSNWEHLKERATTMDGDNPVDEWVPDDIYTEWGLNNLVGYATPDALKPYVQPYTDQAGNELNNLAQKVKASKYYDYVRKGYAIYDNFLKTIDGGKMPDVEIFLPLQLPESINKSPIDIQLISMEFHPTWAWMNLLGMYSLPDNDITENNILMFGAPRMCMDPDRVLPGSGNICLLEDITLKENSSGFEFTFKAPTDTENPSDGCMMSWANDTISLLSLKAEMLLPELVKCDDDGKKIEGEKPKATIEAQVRDWEDWWGKVSLDPFEAEDLPGWTFTAQDIWYDHSQRRNLEGLTFPENYFDAAKNENAYALPPSKYGQNAWQGLYIKKVAMQMPKGFLENGDKRFEVAGNEMLFDKSGVTGSFGLDNLVDCSAGGWALRLKKIALEVQQNSIRGGKMEGDVHVPLTAAEDFIAFECDMIPQENLDNPGALDFLLKIQGTEEGDKNALDGKLKFDFFLADLTLDNKQTYFLLEAIDQGKGQGYNTRVELCLGGDLTISAAESANQQLASYDQQVKHYVPDLPFTLKIPGVHFTQMRLANCPRDEKWTHGQKTRDENQKAVDDDQTKAIKVLLENKTFKLGDSFYFDCGNWSLASYDKQIGPFKFSLEDYNFDHSGNDVSLELKGRIGFLMKGQDDPLVDATTTIAILATADIKNFNFAYKETQFREATLDIKAAGIEISGSLAASNGDEKGYSGMLSFKMPGDLFHIECDGGYYTHKGSDGDFTYGWFHADAGGEALRFDPIQITKIEAGFYFNCVRNVDANGKEQKATPQDGMIGVVAGLGIASSDGELVKEGTFNMTALYDRKNNRLTSMLFTGDLNAAAGMVKAKATIAWVHNDEDKYFQLNVTADVKADKALTEEVSKFSSDLTSDLSKLNSKYEEAVTGAKAGLADAVGVKAGEGSSKPQKEENKTENFETKNSGVSASISLDLKITFMQGGKKFDNCKWHVYLGEPDFDKRCQLTLIDFDSGIVSVKVGANMYLCIGNELPNDGELPPIPTNIANFLNGESKGGMEGADIYKAQKAREAAKKMFAADAETGGGFMMGAEVYGYVDVDLGIFYGGLGVDAGFDVSVRKLAYPVCPQTSDGRMGHNGWYGEGQLYAYLAAKFGIHVNLGFWKEDFDIINAGIGGVLRCGLPHPNYFIGSARIKLKLLGGLVNINRRFNFECGTRCSIFYGNPLDNFELFGDCTLGVPEMNEGWADKADLVDPGFIAQPRFETQAPLDANFRVLDENSLNELLASYSEKEAVEREQLEMQAKRTFVFRRDAKVKLYEFNSRPDSTNFYKVIKSNRMSSTRGVRSSEQWSAKLISVKDFSQTSHGISISGADLKKNKYYAIVVKGSAKEIIKGYEEDPRTFHPEADWPKNQSRWTQEPWRQTQCYFFRTGQAEEVDDAAQLQDYVAIAYPSVRNNLKSTKVPSQVKDKSSSTSTSTGFSQNMTVSQKFAAMHTTYKTVYKYDHVEAYTEDIICPTIALNSDIRSSLYQKGKLVWRLFSTEDTDNETKSTLICEAENQFLENGNCINMVPSTSSDWEQKAEAAINSGTKQFRIHINYETTHTEEYTERVQTGYQTVDQSPEDQMASILRKKTGGNSKGIRTKTSSAGSQQTVPVYEDVTRTREVVDTLAELMDVAVKTVEGTWLIGYQLKGGYKGRHRRDFVEYSKPFMGVKLIKMETDHDNISGINDESVAMDGQNADEVAYRVIDPYWYISYLGNFFFIGGHPIKNYAFETGEDAYGDAVPVSESVIYTDRGGVWSGNIIPGNFYNVQNGIRAIKKLSYDPNLSVYGSDGHRYPLPYFTGEDEWCNSKLLGGQSNRIASPMPSTHLINRYYHMLWSIAAVYYLPVNKFKGYAECHNGNTFYTYLSPSWYWGFHKKHSEGDMKKAMKWFNGYYRGLYYLNTVTYKDYYDNDIEAATLQVPYYQIPLVTGSQYSPDNNKGLASAVPSLKNSLRANQHLSTQMLYLYNRDKVDYKDDRNKYFKPDYVHYGSQRYSAEEALKRIKSLNMSVYRVNAFDIQNMTYDCLKLRERYQATEESNYQGNNEQTDWLFRDYYWSDEGPTPTYE
ncbi:MAG: hypothetical protein IJ754_05110 [Bacteroidaceae bacterium]|nr:hypothetical protein [Bacteroidaceae bacterium]